MLIGSEIEAQLGQQATFAKCPFKTLGEIPNFAIFNLGNNDYVVDAVTGL
jgi:hypothetical protein